MRASSIVSVFILLAATVSGCGHPTTAEDAGVPDAAVAADSGARDAGEPNITDSGALQDAGPMEADAGIDAGTDA